MNAFQVATIALSVMAVVVLPVLGLVLRITVRFTRIEAKLADVVEDIGRLVGDKERVHTAMLEQMTRDRDATDRRLRWLEEHIWKGMQSGRAA